MDLSQFDEQEPQEDQNKDLKIKLLDDLIQKIMSLPDDESKEDPAEEKLESPAMEAKEDLQNERLKKGLNF